MANSLTVHPNPAWVVFEYEADMFFGLCSLLAGDPTLGLMPKRVQNAVTESVGLHTRQLVDILLSRGRFSDDVTAYIAWVLVSLIRG